MGCLLLPSICVKLRISSTVGLSEQSLYSGKALSLALQNVHNKDFQYWKINNHHEAAKPILPLCEVMLLKALSCRDCGVLSLSGANQGRG